MAQFEKVDSIEVIYRMKDGQVHTKVVECEDNRDSQVTRNVFQMGLVELHEMHGRTVGCVEHIVDPTESS